MTGGALGPEGQWIAPKRGFLFPVRALSIVFRGKYLEALKETFEAGKLDFAGETASLGESSAFRAFLTKLRAKGWVVYAKRSFGGPEEVLAYLGRYTHRIAISNERILACENGEARFRWRDYAAWQQKEGDALIRPGIHPSVSPPRAPPGLSAHPALRAPRQRHRTEHLAACRVALDAPPPAPAEPETVEAFLSRVLGADVNRCPHCGQGRLRPIRPVPPLPRATGSPLLRWAA